MHQPTLLSIFQRSYELLRQNLVLLLPCLISSGINVVLQKIVLIPEENLTAWVVSVILHWCVYAAAAGLVTLAAVVAVTSMAGRVWQGGKATIEDGLRVLREAGNDLYQTVIQIAACMFLASVLVIPTGGLSLIGAAYLMMYAVASAVVGQVPGFAAIRESYAIATRRVKQSVGIVGAFLALTLSLWLINGVIHLIPLIGSVLSALLDQLVIAYMSLVVVGFYIDVHRAEAPMHNVTLDA